MKLWSDVEKGRDTTSEKKHNSRLGLWSDVEKGRDTTYVFCT